MLIVLFTRSLLPPALETALRATHGLHIFRRLRLPRGTGVDRLGCTPAGSGSQAKIGGHHCAHTCILGNTSGAGGFRGSEASTHHCTVQKYAKIAGIYPDIMMANSRAHRVEPRSLPGFHLSLSAFPDSSTDFLPNCHSLTSSEYLMMSLNPAAPVFVPSPSSSPMETTGAEFMAKLNALSSLTLEDLYLEVRLRPRPRLNPSSVEPSQLHRSLLARP